MSITVSRFGMTENGESVESYRLENKNGMIAEVLSYGGSVRSLVIPTKNGPVDVALGYETLAGYEKGTSSFGAMVGRFANRIGDASFSLRGEKVNLIPNEGKNHLHGPFGKKVYAGAIEGDTLALSAVSPSAEEGYPGNLTVTFRYTLTEENELILVTEAISDADTVINLTNHSYFNLNGHASGTIFGHTLLLASDAYTEVREGKIPTGRILSVEGTKFDFREEKAVGRDLDLSSPEAICNGGYDLNYCINGDVTEKAAVLTGEKSGITLTVRTSEPGIQVYSGNYVHLDGALAYAKDGASYPQGGGIALETQHYPDSPNHPEFPSTLLEEGKLFRSVTVWEFSAK